MTSNADRDAARKALDDARWEVAHWAGVIAEGKTRETPEAVHFIATPFVARKYAEAVAAEAEALHRFLHVERPGQVTA